MGSSLSEPSPRWGHHSVAVGGQLHVCGGHTKDFSKELAVSVHSFTQAMETWQTRATTGKNPHGLYSGACTSSGHLLLLYGGYDKSCYHDSLYQLDTDSLEWSQLPSGPMRKSGCGMVSYEDKLILFGGYGTPSGPIQTGAVFIENSKLPGRGWTNELHMFEIQKGTVSCVRQESGFCSPECGQARAHALASASLKSISAQALKLSWLCHCWPTTVDPH